MSAYIAAPSLSDKQSRVVFVVAEVTALHDECRAMAVSWFSTLDDVTKRRIGDSIGPMPPVETQPLSVAGGPLWHWWELAALPLDEDNKLIILAMTSLSKRLRALKHVLTYIERHRSR